MIILRTFPPAASNRRELLFAATTEILSAFLQLPRRRIIGQAGLESVCQFSTCVLGGRTDPMAVPADDIALGDLRLENDTVLQIDLSGSQAEGLRLGISMVEVHDMRWKGSSAVHARHATQVPQPSERRPLTLRDARDLRVAIPRVVGDVVRALVPRARHKTF